MDTTRVTREVRLTKWAAILRERQESGQSIRRYCDLNGINEKSYYYWQRQLRVIACTSLASGPEKAPGGWALYAPAASNISANTSELIIEVGGCLIHANDRVEPELLAKVCRVLRSLC